MVNWVHKVLSIHNGVLKSGQLFVENIRFLCNGMKWISIYAKNVVSRCLEQSFANT